MKLTRDDHDILIIVAVLVVFYLIAQLVSAV